MEYKKASRIFERDVFHSNPYFLSMDFVVRLSNHKTHFDICYLILFMPQAIPEQPTPKKTVPFWLATAVLLIVAVIIVLIISFLVGDMTMPQPAICL